MIALRQVEIPFFRGISRKRGWGFGAFAHLGELQTSFCLNLSTQPRNAWVLTCWYLLLQNLLMFLVVEKVSRKLQSVRRNKLKENNSVLVARKKLQQEPLQQNLQNTSVVRREKCLQTFLTGQFKYFSVPNICGSFSKSARETASS